MATALPQAYLVLLQLPLALEALEGRQVCCLLMSCVLWYRLFQL